MKLATSRYRHGTCSPSGIFKMVAVNTKTGIFQNIFTMSGEPKLAHMYYVLHRLMCNLVSYATAMISGRHLGFQNYPILMFGIVIQLTRTIIWQVNEMLLLLLVACQYSLHNNIVIMCVIYKQTRYTARCRHMVRYICRGMCPVNSMQVICTGACSPSCIRSVHVRSMQLTPLLVQSKMGSTPNEM